MNVCLLNDSFKPVIDGVVNVVLNYARYLPENHGAKVIVGTPEYPGTDYSEFPYPVVPYQSIDTTAVANGYRAGNPLHEKAVSQLARFSPEIIHSHCPATATIIARLLREQTGAPIVFTYHTKYDIDIAKALKSEHLAQGWIKAMVSNIDACDDIWVVSEGAGKSLKALGLKKDYTVMNNGVDFEKGRVDEQLVAKATEGYDLPEGVPVLLFVGRMMSYKNVPLILDALKILSDSGQDFRMVLIGKGGDEELFKEKAREYGLLDSDVKGRGKCIFRGAIYDRNELRAWNTRADLFLFPSTYDTNGLVVREAAACGLASVLIRNSCAAEGVTDGRNGFIIDENPESMAEFLKKACRDLDHLHEAGEHAMEEIYMSWSSCVDEAYNRYQVVLENKKEGRLEKRKQDASEFLFSAIAHNMSEMDKFRQIRNRYFDDFRSTATGMMENFQETVEEFAEDFQGSAEGFAGSLHAAMEELEGNIQAAANDMKGNFEHFISPPDEEENGSGNALETTDVSKT